MIYFSSSKNVIFSPESPCMCLLYPFVSLFHPFMFLIHPFTSVTVPFMLLFHPFMSLFHPFMPLFHPFMPLFHPFLSLFHPFLSLFHPQFCPFWATFFGFDQQWLYLVFGGSSKKLLILVNLFWPMTIIICWLLTTNSDEWKLNPFGVNCLSHDQQMDLEVVKNDFWDRFAF